MYFTFSRRTKIAGTLIILCGVIGIYGYSAYGYDRALDAYVKAGNGQDTAAYVPGAPDNATRQILNRILSDILTRKLSNEDRIRLAQEGLEALEVSEKEIDAIGYMGENVTTTMDRLQSRFTLLHAGDTRDLLALAQKRFEVSSDIRGLSYLANHHIAEIFNRVIRDGGVVTPEHTAELNRKIPEVEADFDRRANLYRDLASLAFTINKDAAALLW